MLYPLQPVALLFQAFAALCTSDGGPLIDPHASPDFNPAGLEGEEEGGPAIDPDG